MTHTQQALALLREACEAKAWMYTPNAVSAKVRAAIASLEAAPAAPEFADKTITAREVARQVFALCEWFEDLPDGAQDSQEEARFKAGQRFSAKRIRNGIGTWLTDEENARKQLAGAAPAAPADERTLFIKEETERLYGAAPAAVAEPADLKRAMQWGAMYDKASRLVAAIGHRGVVESDADEVELLQDALHAIDNGQHMPGLMPRYDAFEALAGPVETLGCDDAAGSQGLNPPPTEPSAEPMRCAGCDIPNGCPEYCRCAPASPEPSAEVVLPAGEVDVYLLAESMHCRLERLKKFTPIDASSIWDEAFEECTATVDRLCAAILADRAARGFLLELTREQVSALAVHLAHRQRPAWGWMDAPLAAIEQAIDKEHAKIHKEDFAAMDAQFHGITPTAPTQTGAVK